MATDGRVPRYLGRILNDDGVAVGTCFQVTEHVLVTAWHVLDAIGAGNVGDAVEIDTLAEAAVSRRARVLRVDPSHDLAILHTDVPLADVVSGMALSDQASIGTAIVITGVSDVDDPGHEYRFLHATGSWEGGTVRDEQVPLGRLTARSVTRGMSGGPVRRLADDVVLGVLSGRYNSLDGWLRDTVWVARTEELRRLVPEHITPASTSYGCADYRLDPLPRTPKVRRLRGPSDLLDVNRAVVPYRERSIDWKLAGWRDGTVHTSAIFIHGEGGQGKTRAARHCAVMAISDGWEVVQATNADGSRQPAVAHDVNRPLLILVDYVERWKPDVIGRLADDLSETERPRIRLLLISRTVSGMWEPVQAVLDPLIDDMPDPIGLAGFTTSDVDQDRAFADAVTAFQRAMNLSIVPLRPHVDATHERSPLALHMAALATVCADRDGVRPPRRTDVSAFLLRHERRYWLHTLGMQQNVARAAAEIERLEKVVVVATLIGPIDDQAEARRLLQKLGIVDEDAQADDMLALHARLYPPLMPTQMLTPLHPDRLAEDFLAECLPRQGYSDLVSTILKHHAPRREGTRLRIVSVIAATADRHEAVAVALHQLMTEQPDMYTHVNSKGTRYYLHRTQVTLRGGKPQTIYFFAKSPDQWRVRGEPTLLPDDRVVKENPRNGFLTISKRKV